jgi:hypothetical protein
MADRTPQDVGRLRAVSGASIGDKLIGPYQDDLRLIFLAAA